jgi:hypothetical protein
MASIRRCGSRLVLLVLCWGCPEPSRVEVPRPESGTLRIEETTQIQVNGNLIAPGNLWVEDYTDAAGNAVRGPRAMLSILEAGETEGRNERVHEGDLVRVGGVTYRVESIEPGESARGWVTLVQVDPPLPPE